MKPRKRVPPRLLPHLDSLKIEVSKGANANGRSYGPPESPKRSLIFDGSALVGGKYEPQSKATGTIYVESEDLTSPPPPESRITIWVGTPNERVGYVDSWNRYFDPNIGDLLEIRIK